jgi:hypothetical protein
MDRSNHVSMPLNESAAGFVARGFQRVKCAPAAAARHRNWFIPRGMAKRLLTASGKLAATPASIHIAFISLNGG